MTTPSREMALVAACCRWPPSPARDTTVRAAASDIDWPTVERLVARHRVPGLVYAALRAAQAGPPAARMAPWLAAAATTARRGTLLATLGAALQAELDARGLPALIVKGAPLAQLAYGTLDLKHAKDIDLLVAPGDMPAVIALLQQQGYRLVHPAATLGPAQLRDVLRYDRDIGFVHDAYPGVQLELHWGLSRNRHILPGLDARAPTQTVELGKGRVVRTLQRDDLFAYMCAHGASHGWFRLKWLTDLAALAVQHDVAQLYRAAQARGVATSAAQALLLAHDMLALDLPDPLAAELRNNRRVRRLVRAAHALIAGRGAEADITDRRFSQARLHYAQWLLVRDWRDFRANLAHYLTVTGDVLAVPLPPRWHFLYPLLRLPLGLARLARKRSARRVDHA
jgi:hypothetical protein